MQALYHYFMATSSERASDVKIRLPIASEYRMYKYLWETFGINAIQAQDLDPQWLQLMIICGSQDNKVQADRMKERSSKH